MTSSDKPTRTHESGDAIRPFAETNPVSFADQFEVLVYWMGDEPMLRGRTYLLRAGTSLVAATVAPLKYRLDLRNLGHVAATQLKQGEVGMCSIELAQQIGYDPNVENTQTRGVLLIDPTTQGTVGACLIRFALRRSQNVGWQSLDIGKELRASAKSQRPCIIWLTGISGAGKSTIANLVERELHARACHTYLLDGDNVRHGLNKDLGFTAPDRAENIRRVAEVANLMIDAGLIVIVAFISPFKSERRMARALVKPGEFLEVYVDAPLQVAEQRDPKGLYAKARRGELANFTGIDSPYEPPEHPDLHIDTTRLSASEAAEAVIRLLERSDRLTAPSVIAPQVHSAGQVSIPSSR